MVEDPQRTQRDFQQPLLALRLIEKASHLARLARLPFLGMEMVESFLTGLSHNALDHLDNAAEFIRKMPMVVTKAALDLPSEKKAELSRVVRRTSEDKAEEFLQAVMKDAFDRQEEVRKAEEALTIQELAQVASTLVNLSSFQQQMSLGQQTVGGPIDVAVISKGDGFVWIDRKHYFRPELNNHFFQTYYERASKDGSATSGNQGGHNNG